MNRLVKTCTARCGLELVWDPGLASSFRPEKG